MLRSAIRVLLTGLSNSGTFFAAKFYSAQAPCVGAMQGQIAAAKDFRIARPDLCTFDATYQVL
jgi:hypothetical protein